MQKENVVKKIFIRSAIGFPIGVTLLMLSYICIFFLFGEDIFNLELYQLHNINTLILQIVSLGIAGCILTFSSQLGNAMYTPIIQNKLKSFVKTHPWKTQFLILLCVLCEYIIVAFLLTNSIFSKTIAISNIFIYLLSNTFFVIFSMIRGLIQGDLIRKINQKIKERKQ